MLQYFKLGSWDRLIFLLLLACLIQLPFFFFPPDILVSELYRIRLGERLADGWRLYAQIQDETAPLPALVYAAMAKIGILHVTGLRATAFLLLLGQAFWFNSMVHRYQLVTDKHYLIAFFYLIFSHLGPDCHTLSPILLGNTFHLFAFGRFFRILKEGPASDDAMVMGIWLGLAALCYPLMALFILAFLVSALFFTGLRINQFFTILVAVTLPWALVYPFYLVGGGETEFLSTLGRHFRLGFLLPQVDWDVYLALSGMLLVISILGWIVGNLNSRVNFQRMGFMVFFFSLVLAFLLLFPGPIRSTENILMLVPHAAFFAVQFMLYTRGFLMQELVNLFWAGFFLAAFFAMSDVEFGTRLLRHRLFVDLPPKGFRANFTGRSILVLDSDPRYFLQNPPATRFLRYYLDGMDPHMAQTHEGLIFWYQILAEDPPNLIYDPHQLIPAVAVRIPEFGSCYRATFYPHLYESIPGKTFGRR